MAISEKLTMRPLYMQVRDLLLQRITSAVWKPGSPLPSEVDLAKELGVSSGTVRKALDRLEAEHVVSRRQGKGTFVNDGSAGEVAWRYDNIRDKDNQGIVASIVTSDVSTGPASEVEQQRLELPEGEQVVRIRQVHYNDGRPYMYEDVSLPERLFSGLATRGDVPRGVAELAQQFGLILGRGCERVSLALASDAVAGKLSVAVGSALLRLDRVVFAIDGHPVQWRIALCHLTDEQYVTEFN